MKKFNKLYTFKAKEDLKTDIYDVLNDEETMSSFIRTIIYSEIINRKKQAKLKDISKSIHKINRPIVL